MSWVEFKCAFIYLGGFRRILKFEGCGKRYDPEDS